MAVAGALVPALCLLYALVLVVGLATLPTPEHPIQDPWFTLMELLILAIAPAMVIFTVALHGCVAAENRHAALLGVIFMSLCAGVTSCVHFSILVLSRQPEIAAAEWAPLVFSFTWPSLAYALDILAWDFFFALAALFAALALRNESGHGVARVLLFAAAILAFIGLAGVPLANMSVRNIGIIGYVVLFPVATALVARAQRSTQ
jgi:hypothetical protein